MCWLDYNSTRPIVRIRQPVSTMYVYVRGGSFGTTIGLNTPPTTQNVYCGGKREKHLNSNKIYVFLGKLTHIVKLNTYIHE